MKQKIELYIISLFLLFFIFFVTNLTFPISFEKGSDFIGLKELLKLNMISCAMLIFMGIGLFFYWRFDYKVVKGATSLPRKITAIKNINFETLSFLATYIFPLVCIDIAIKFDRNLILLVLLILIIGFIYVRTNIFYTNPTLAIFGFRVYQIDTEPEKEMIVVVKGILKKDDLIYPKRIDENVYFVKRKK